MKSKNNKGFTLIELMVITSIVGILAGASLYSIGHYIKDKRSEQHVLTLWSELSSLRARALKDNCPYIVQFDLSNNTYKVWRNDSISSGTTSKHYSLTSPNSIQVLNGYGAASGKITNGFPTGTVSNLIVNGTTYTPSGDKMQSQWKTGVNALTSSIVFEKDAIGNISNGAIFLQNSSVKKVGYAILKTPNSNTILLYKWDGSKWYKM